MARVTTIVTAALLTAFVFAPAKADMTDDCIQEANPDLSVGGCTAAIRSGNWSGEDLNWAFYNRGNAYSKLGDLQKAIDDYTQAIALKSTDASSYYNRGNAYSDLKEHDKAIYDFSQAIKIEPDFAHAYGNRARERVELKQYELALVDYNLALKFDSQNAIDYNGRGYLFHKMERYSEALNDYNTALRLMPDFANAYLNRGTTYETLGLHEDAVNDWEQQINIEGASRVKWWQEIARDNGGHYKGPIDGVYSPEVRKALLACSVDPGC
ncbi:MAG: tetratricopeptide repeat protein [Pseudomonadota bacterium]